MMVIRTHWGCSLLVRHPVAILKLGGPADPPALWPFDHTAVAVQCAQFVSVRIHCALPLHEVQLQPVHWFFDIRTSSDLITWMGEGLAASVADGISVRAVPPKRGRFGNIYLCTMGPVSAPDLTLPHMSLRTQSLSHHKHEGTMYFRNVDDLPLFHAHLPRRYYYFSET
jgi:hypothetical protein